MSTITKSRRSKALRIALGAFIACYVALYAMGTIWRLDYSSSRFCVLIESGALGVFALKQNARLAFPDSGWTFTDSDHRPLLVQWPQFTQPSSDSSSSIDLVIPLWLPLIPLLLFSSVIVYRDRTRRVPGFCRKCGYNLQGNTTGRCPECGAPISTDPSNTRTAETEPTK